MGPYNVHTETCLPGRVSVCAESQVVDSGCPIRRLQGDNAVSSPSVASVCGEMEKRFCQRTRAAIRHVLARSLSLRENAGACLEYETSSCQGGNDVK